MSQPLRTSLGDTIFKLSEILHTVAASGLDFGFEQEQIAYQIESLTAELDDSITHATRMED